MYMAFSSIEFYPLASARDHRDGCVRHADRFLSLKNSAVKMTKAPMQMHQRFSGGEDATRTHNALRHTTFPMWLLTN
jgi:hypothetical protein